MSGLREHTERWTVRTYEVDENGHVNNAVYVQWAEEVTARHAEATGFGREWSIERGGAWLVRRHEITYHRPARRGDEVELTVRVLSVGGVRGRRQTTIRRVADGTMIAEVASEWVWVRISDGRPAAVPSEIVDAYAAEATSSA
ncbi:MAG: thioesterase family protein [Chloroflexota bacterium]